MVKPIQTDRPTLHPRIARPALSGLCGGMKRPVAAVVLAANQMAEKKFGVSVEHSLQREIRNDTFPVLASEPFPRRRLMQQAPDRGGKSGGIVARNNKILIVPRHHCLEIPDIDSSDRQAGGHSLE